MLQAQPNDSVPEETARIAHQIFPKGGFLHYPRKGAIQIEIIETHFLTGCEATQLLNVF